MGLVQVTDGDLLTPCPLGEGRSNPSFLAQRPFGVPRRAKVLEEGLDVCAEQAQRRAVFRCEKGVYRHVVSPYPARLPVRRDHPDYAASAIEGGQKVL
jgi:hypothetical protein